MNLAAALGVVGLAGRSSTVIAFVGAGGKTSAMFAIAGSAGTSSVTITTTTHIRDPRTEEGRRFERVVVESDLALHPGKARVSSASLAPARGGPPLIVASGLLPAEGKLRGIHPERAQELARRCDILLVEADGSRGRAIKAPADHEPVIPPCSDIVVGLVGLDCIGQALSSAIAHRPEILAPLVGCAEGQEIEPRHVAALVRSPRGLFKDAPPGSRRVIVLNKADRPASLEIRKLLDLIREEPGTADLAIVCALAEGAIFEALDLADPATSREAGGYRV
jgi:probable selenium-dependent hydroxylase accessory protein YqeC